MKKTVSLSLILAASLGLAACGHKDSQPPVGNGTSNPKADECPRADGTPCR